MLTRFDSDTLMLMSGFTENKEHSIYYFMFDIEKEVFTQERSDRKLIHPFRDRQGNRDYKSQDKIFCQLSEGKVKCFNKKTYYWDNLSIYLMKIEKNSSAAKGLMSSLGCGGSRSDKKDLALEETKDNHADQQASGQAGGDRGNSSFKQTESKVVQESNTTKGGSHLGMASSKLN